LIPYVVATVFEQHAGALQRADDTEEKAQTRLQVYHDNMQAVKSCYTDQIVEIDGNVEMDVVFQQVTAALDHMYELA
jgi:adenylate kinase family enzyme